MFCTSFSISQVVNQEHMDQSQDNSASIPPHETITHTNITHTGDFQKGKKCSQHSVCIFELYNTEEKQWNLSIWAFSLTITASENTAVSGKLGMQKLFCQESHTHILGWPEPPSMSHLVKIQAILQPTYTWQKLKLHKQ